MKIVMFTNTYRPHVGGVANSVHTFAETFRKKGHECIIIAPEFEGTETENDPNIKRVPAIQNFNGSDFSVRIPLPNQIDNWLEEFNPDIIHSHHPFLLGDSAVRCGYENQVPVIFTHHTLYENYTHYVPGDSEPMKRAAIELATAYANLCDHAIAPSESVAKMMKERGVTTPITSIPTGVNVDFYASGDGHMFREEFNIPTNAVVLGHVGRLAEEKNLGYLTQAAVEILKQEPDWYFLVIGDGPAKAKMIEIAEESGVEDRFILAGKHSGQAIANAYGAMDAFIFSSQSETQGMVIAEAMAAHLPVVALDGPGVREVVKDGQNGRLLPRDASVDTFVEAVVNLLKSDDFDKIVASAKETAKDFSEDATADRLLIVYNRLVAENYFNRKEDWTFWDRLLERIEVEWDLLGEKLSAAKALFTEDPKKEKTLD